MACETQEQPVITLLSDEGSLFPLLDNENVKLASF